MTETQFRRVGKFELHELIGEGAMGAVWKAYDSVVRRFVALKLLPSAVGRSTDARDRFLREARAAGALQHPNIVTLKTRSEEHTSELQSQSNLVCRLLLEKKKKKINPQSDTPPDRCTRHTRAQAPA